MKPEEWRALGLSLSTVSAELGKEGIAEAGVGGLGVEGDRGEEDGASVRSAFAKATA